MRGLRGLLRAALAVRLRAGGRSSAGFRSPRLRAPARPADPRCTAQRPACRHRFGGRGLHLHARRRRRRAARGAQRGRLPGARRRLLAARQSARLSNPRVPWCAGRARPGAGIGAAHGGGPGQLRGGRSPGRLDHLLGESTLHLRARCHRPPRARSGRGRQRLGPALLRCRDPEGYDLRCRDPVRRSRSDVEGPGRRDSGGQGYPVRPVGGVYLVRARGPSLPLRLRTDQARQREHARGLARGPLCGQRADRLASLYRAGHPPGTPQRPDSTSLRDQRLLELGGHRAAGHGLRLLLGGQRFHGCPVHGRLVRRSVHSGERCLPVQVPEGLPAGKPAYQLQLRRDGHESVAGLEPQSGSDAQDPAQDQRSVRIGHAGIRGPELRSPGADRDHHLGPRPQPPFRLRKRVAERSAQAVPRGGWSGGPHAALP